MSFRPEAIRGARSGEIDYRLARRHLLAEFGRGRLSRLDLCDAHPELIRAADNVGQTSDVQCPICSERPLVYVSYVFGTRLPAHGRCVTSLKEITTFSKQNGSYVCYVVEVCSGCRWNHLHRMFRLGRASAG